MKTYFVYQVHAFNILSPEGGFIDSVELKFIELKHNREDKVVQKAKEAIQRKQYRVSSIVEYYAKP